MAGGRRRGQRSGGGPAAAGVVAGLAWAALAVGGALGARVPGGGGLLAVPRNEGKHPLLADPGSPFEVERYMGRWYQVYGSLSVMDTFERHGQCVTADYGLNDDGTVSVFNAMRVGAPDGKLSTIEGQASIPNPRVPTHLKVHFPNTHFDGQYWIYSYGWPDPETGLYSFSVVSDFYMANLFILARDPEKFKQQEESVLNLVKETLGFKHFWNRPHKVVQGPQCQYVPSPQEI